ncbi:unnamed protein product [Clavelina lepadiformis]|uniref:Uncharacterized protein n=1 Tax=Clavelina lepadiformis TaxID=159417 RepID=A0ABP0GD24_CLALP
MHKSDEKQLDQPHAQDGNVQKHHGTKRLKRATSFLSPFTQFSQGILTRHGKRRKLEIDSIAEDSLSICSFHMGDGFKLNACSLQISFRVFNFSRFSLCLFYVGQGKHYSKAKPNETRKLMTQALQDLTR